MATYKGIKSSETSLNEIEVYKSFTLDSKSNGINSIQFRSGSLKNNNKTPTISGSYWNSLFVNFYLSGSYRNTQEEKYGYIGHTFGIHDDLKPQHRNKFHSSGSVIFVPQQYFGERIRRGSFSLTSGGVALKDDERGNLYSTTTTHTSSADTSISSSANYKGNVFYNHGVVTITDTGSYGGVNYTNLTTGSFTIGFESTHTIYVKEYTITVNPKEFNSTANPTIRALASCSNGDNSLMCISHSASPYMKSNLTASKWTPHMNTIGFYGDNDHFPVMVARYPQPIKMRDDMKLIFRVTMDF